MAVLDLGQLLDALKKAGFPDSAIPIAVGIAKAESGGDPLAHNPVPPDNSYGLFQINMIGALGPSRRATFGLSSNADLFDPVTNAKAAYAISKGGTDWTPWTTFTSGAYKEHVPPLANWTDRIPNPLDEGKEWLADAFGAAVEPFVTGLRRLSIIGIAVLGGVALVVAGAWRGVKA